MNFFSMLSKVEAEEAKQKTAIGKKTFEMPAVGASDAEAASDAESIPAKKKTRKKETMPEGNDADNILQEDDEPENITEEE